jgi:DNA gyrase subunit A
MQLALLSAGSARCSGRFKAVHRRIYLCDGRIGLRADKPTRKSAQYRRDVMGKYHPHGDSAIYDAMAECTGLFEPIPLGGRTGNFGSIEWDSPAAMRYTEAKMSKLSLNFCGTSTKKPLILPEL